MTSDPLDRLDNLAVPDMWSDIQRASADAAPGSKELGAGSGLPRSSRSQGWSPKWLGAAAAALVALAVGISLVVTGVGEPGGDSELASEPTLPSDPASPDYVEERAASLGWALVSEQACGLDSKDEATGGTAIFVTGTFELEPDRSLDVAEIVEVFESDGSGQGTLQFDGGAAWYPRKSVDNPSLHRAKSTGPDSNIFVNATTAEAAAKRVESGPIFPEYPDRCTSTFYSVTGARDAHTPVSQNDVLIGTGTSALLALLIARMSGAQFVAHDDARKVVYADETNTYGGGTGRTVLLDLRPSRIIMIQGIELPPIDDLVAAFAPDLSSTTIDDATPSAPAAEANQETPSADSPGGAPVSGAAACADQTVQIPGDPYSPVCLTFSGDNGGATSTGVTAESITISARILDHADRIELLEGAATTRRQPESPDVQKQTIEGLVEYFNSRFQFYGRQLKVEFFDGKGNFLTEITAGGVDDAKADAAQAKSSIRPFAELNGLTLPYADALAQSNIISVGVTNASASWLADRGPFVWSDKADCTTIANTMAEYINKRVAGGRASFAGDPGLRNQDRKIGVVTPSTGWNRDCFSNFASRLDNPDSVVIEDDYVVDLGQASTQAHHLIGKLRAEGVTTVLCACDPIFTVFLTGQARVQGFGPEWLNPGVEDLDTDAIGQLTDLNTWHHAFGPSFRGPSIDRLSGPGYAAFTSARPGEQPSRFVESIYSRLYILALGIHLAGPNLTPETFAAGLATYESEPGGK